MRVSTGSPSGIPNSAARRSNTGCHSTTSPLAILNASPCARGSSQAQAMARAIRRASVHSVSRCGWPG
ncbi:Uncharacterised protein [Bordetella pertussis]|nr:Uncharacterised protein [Bordetella pertussis]